MKLMKKLPLLFLFLNFLCLEVKAAEISEYYTLKNGMEVLLIKDDRIPLVTHTVWYRVGTIDDPMQKSGIAHFLEHMMFKRFGMYQTGEYVNSVEKNGGIYNAFTGSYYTAYYATVPSNKLELMMKLESARMTQLKLEKTDEQEFEKEKLVVLDERRRRIDTNPAQRLLEQMEYYNYKNNKFAVPGIGWNSEIKNITLKDMKTFYEKYYAPNNSILIISGNFDFDQTKKLVKQHYGSINKTVPKNIHKYFPIDSTEVKGNFSLSDPKAVNTVFYMFNYKPINQYNEIESYMINGLGSIVANSINSRLYQELVENQNIANNVNASISCSPYHPCQFLISAESKDNESLKKLSKSLIINIEDIQKFGITKDELNLAKNLEEHSVHKFLYGSLRDKSLTYGLLLLENYDIKKILNLKSNYKKDINSITQEQMNLMAKNLFKSNYVRGILKNSSGSELVK